MKKIGNKFIIAVILVIASIVASQVFIAYSQSSRDTNSYLSLISGNATLNDIRLNTDNKAAIVSGDTIRVIGESSLALIEWWDGSMTRLWGNTKITITQNEISRDITDINISFELIAWKTWSNIVSFIWSDSSFTQTFEGIEAWVRGTVFDVDLEKQFIHASDHSVEITDQQGETFILSEWSILNLESFSLIDFSQYIKNIRDSAWTELNENLDQNYISELRSDLESSFISSNPFLYLMRFISPKYAIFYVLDTYEDYRDVDTYISSLSPDTREQVYPDVLSRYQEINFVSSLDTAYYTKLRYKKALIDLDVNSENSQRLVVTSAFDLQDIIDSWSTQWLGETLNFIQGNASSLDSENLNILKWWLDYIPEGLLEEFSDNFNTLWEILNIDFSQIQNINSWTFWEVLDTTDQAIQNFLEENVGGILDQFSN